MLGRTNLHSYQERAVDYIISHPSSALFLQMGLGKSVITLTAIADLIDFVECRKVLVIAPKKVAEATWAQEVASWSHLNHLRTSVILGDAKKRTKAIQTDADIYVTSRDMVVWIYENMKALHFEFDMLVLDELTSFKNSASKRFKALRKMRAGVTRCVGLTGTPTPNGYIDLWAQMYCVDMGKSLGRSKTDYSRAFFNEFKNAQGITLKYTLKNKEAERQIWQRLETTALTMKAEDFLDLPPLIERTLLVTLPPKIQKEYETFEKESVLEFAKECESGEQPEYIIANSAGALCNKLCQYANGAIYDVERNVLPLHDEKLDLCMETIESALAGGEHVLLFYQYQHDKDRILEKAEAMKIKARKYENDKDLEDWNAGKIELLVTHPASTAYGLNLQKGGHVIIWFGTGWNSEYYLQGNARLHRQGQQQPVVVYRIVTADTMDVKAFNAVGGKVKSQDAMLNALKEKAKLYLKQ